MLHSFIYYILTCSVTYFNKNFVVTTMFFAKVYQIYGIIIIQQLRRQYLLNFDNFYSQSFMMTKYKFCFSVL